MLQITGHILPKTIPYNAKNQPCIPRTVDYHGNIYNKEGHLRKSSFGHPIVILMMY
jgi:hypothetical protein